jgi:hypothetical protein
MKNSKSILLILVLTLIFSCQKDDSVSVAGCGVENPTEDLPWLKEMIESWNSDSLRPYMYVQQGTYLGQTVFLPGSCCPFCDFFFPVYNCKGETITLENGQQVTNLKTIWKPLNSECTL